MRREILKRVPSPPTTKAETKNQTLTTFYDNIVPDILYTVRDVHNTILK